MRFIVSTAAVLSAMAFLGGCAGEKVAAKAPAAPHVSVAMDEATSRLLLGEDEVAVGTTTLTSATFELPAPLPADRGSLGVLTPVRTWGTEPAEIDGIPTTRE